MTRKLFYSLFLFLFSFSCLLLLSGVAEANSPLSWSLDRSVTPFDPQYNVDGTWKSVKLNGVISADSFAGVDPTGVTDSTTGVQAALNAAAPGSTVYFGGKYYVGNLTVPDHVTVECGLSYPDPKITAGVGLTQSPYTWKGQFKQKTGTTITPGQGVVFRKCLIIREGLALPVTTAAGATTLLTQMEGTAFTLDGVSAEFDHVAIFGSEFPIKSSNVDTLSPRVHITNSIFDNLNGPKLSGGLDPHIIKDNQIFPFLTLGLPETPIFTTKAIWERPGVALWMLLRNNVSQITGNLIFGYEVCIQGVDVETAEYHIENNHCEHAPATPTSSNNFVGFTIGGYNSKASGNLSIGYTYSYLTTDGGAPAGSSHTILTNNTAVCPAFSGPAFRFASGSFDFSNNHIMNCNTGIDVLAGVLRGHIGYNEFSNVTTKLSNASSGPIIVDGFSTTPTVTAATYAVLASDTSVTCNGAATITLTLPTAANYPGRKLVVRTIAAFTVVSATANVVPLAGGAAGTAILPAVAGKWAIMESDGTNWKIVGAGADLDGPLTWGAQQTFSVAPIFTTLTGYLKGNGAAALTAAATIPSADFADGNTGTGNIAHATSPTFVTPILGVASATSAKITGVAIAALGTCDGTTQGTLKWVDDTVASAAPTFHATVAGGGATTVHSLVSCDGTNWVWN